MTFHSPVKSCASFRNEPVFGVDRKEKEFEAFIGSMLQDYWGPSLARPYHECVFGQHFVQISLKKWV